MEIEAKFLADAGLLVQLAGAGEVAGWPVVESSQRQLETVYYDTQDGRLAAQHCSLRLRRGEPQGTLLSFKRGQVAGEVSRRQESEVVVPPDYNPSQPSFHTIPLFYAERVIGRRPLAPVLTLVMDRTALIVDTGQARLKLCLDLVSRPDRPDWCDYEIEVELVAGPEAELIAFVQQLRQEHGLKPSASSKAERAMRA